jgi:two-component system nitrogen regulation response regulator GlnG
LILGRGNVLIADDDAAIRTVVNQALARAGYSPRATSNAATLWNWISHGEGDVVITDVIMPDENAFDLLPRIKKIRPDLPVIVMSAQNTFMTAITAAERGAYEYLPKPFDLKELVAVVSRALKEPKGPARPGRRGAAADRALAGHAGSLPGHGAADAYRSDGDDHRRVRHRQGAGRARASRLRPAPQRPVHRHQHGRDPARADRIGAVRP